MPKEFYKKIIDTTIIKEMFFYDLHPVNVIKTKDGKISLIDLDNLKPEKQVTCIITHNDGNKEEILLNHSYNKLQIEWFRQGSALNVLSNKK